MEAVIYARISKDRAGQALGVARQVESCTAKATALGWTVAETYVDNDVTASQGKPRPEYDRMLADLSAGKYGAVVVYDLDRLTRRLSELATFMDLHKSHGFELANVSGDVDLTTANGRMIAGIKGSVAQQEAERIGERNKAQKAQRAAMGLPMGTRYRVYGYNRDWTINETEAVIVRDLFSRYLSGESQHSLTKWMISQGNLTTADKDWSDRASNRLLTNAGYAGIYVFKGERIGKTSYPALIDEATFEAANADRQSIGPHTRKYLLTNILICNVCKAGMVGSSTKAKGVRYRCNIQAGGCGGVSIKADYIDDRINAYMSHAVLFDKSADKAIEEPITDTRLEDKDKEIDAIVEADLELADKVALLRKARKERALIIKDQTATVETKSYWQPIADYDSADVSVRRSLIRRYIKHIFVYRVSGKLAEKNMWKRWAVLTSDTHPSPNQLVSGMAFDTTDLRAPAYGFLAHQKPQNAI